MDCANQQEVYLTRAHSVREYSGMCGFRTLKTPRSRRPLIGSRQVNWTTALTLASERILGEILTANFLNRGPRSR